jgi:hypothetical protein
MAARAIADDPPSSRRSEWLFDNRRSHGRIRGSSPIPEQHLRRALHTHHPGDNSEAASAEEPPASPTSRKRVTEQLSGDAEEPVAAPRLRPKYLGGHGYGVMTITLAGRVRITMRLADGQHFSLGQNFSAPLSISFVAAPISRQL